MQLQRERQASRDLEPAAEQRLGIPEARALGRALDAVLAAAADDLRAEVSPILSGGREAGQLVLIDPPDKPDKSY